MDELVNGDGWIERVAWGWLPAKYLLPVTLTVALALTLALTLTLTPTLTRTLTRSLALTGGEAE